MTSALEIALVSTPLEFTQAAVVLGEQRAWVEALIGRELVEVQPSSRHEYAQLAWFYGAPDLRFGGFLFWTLPAVVFAPMVANAMRDTTVRSLVIALSLAMCAWNGGLTPRLDEIVPKLFNRPIAPQRVGTRTPRHRGAQQTRYSRRPRVFS